MANARRWRFGALLAVALLAVVLVRPESDPAESVERLAGSDGAVVSAPESVPLRHTDDGFLVLRGHGPTAGSPAAPLTRYTVEVEPALEHRAAELLRTTETALLDPVQGWTATGAVRLKRVASPHDADLRVILAAPATVDSYCNAAGMATNGLFSCYAGPRVMLSDLRWRDGAPGFRDIEQYRLYQVNHEFGHGLGQQHLYCAGTGQVAPVMMQQSKGLMGCEANSWPYPSDG